MILEFSVGNFRSIKDIQTLSLVSQPLKSRFSWVDDNKIFEEGAPSDVLKSKALFGANGSGKSNLIKAVAVFIKIVGESVKNEDVLSSYITPFLLNEGTINEPSFFQIQFTLDNILYRYGFEATKKAIESEWLFGYPLGKEVRYFTRENQDVDSNRDKFKEGKKISFLFEEENEIVRENSLFLSAVGSLNGKLSKKIVDYVTNIIVVSGVYDSFMKSVAYNKLEDVKFKNEVVSFMNGAGIDISDLVVKNVDPDEFNLDDENIRDAVSRGKTIKTIGAERLVYSSENEISNKVVWSFEEFESDGTQKILQLSPFIIDSIQSGRPLVLDEFEARLHTKLAKAVVELFNSSTSNPLKSQFIFSTHDTNLLSSKLLRRDQIAFVKKNERGESSTYDLSDIKGVRNDESYEKNYILGKYDSVPVLSNLSAVILDSETNG